MASEWTAEAATFPVPLEVDGMVAALSHLKGVEVQVDAGVVRLVLKNYTGVCTINLVNKGLPRLSFALSLLLAFSP